MTVFTSLDPGQPHNLGDVATHSIAWAIESQVFQGSLNAETPLSGEELEVQGRQAVQDGYLRDLSCPAWETPATCCSGDLKCGLICEILL